MGDVGGTGSSPPDDEHEPLLHPDTRAAFAHHKISAKKSASMQAVALEPFLTEVASDGQGNLISRVLGKLSDTNLPSPLREHWLNSDGTILVLTEVRTWEPGATGTYVAVVTNSSFKILPVPISFGQYQDDEIVGISDIDGDGNIEIWIESSVGECDGDEGTQQVGVDCDVRNYHRLEQFGDSFIPFVDGPRPKVLKREGGGTAAAGAPESAGS
jgi:hypothetical protein